MLHQVTRIKTENHRSRCCWLPNLLSRDFLCKIKNKKYFRIDVIVVIICCWKRGDDGIIIIFFGKGSERSVWEMREVGVDMLLLLPHRASLHLQVQCQATLYRLFFDRQSSFEFFSMLLLSKNTQERIEMRFWRS